MITECWILFMFKWKGKEGIERHEFFSSEQSAFREARIAETNGWNVSMLARFNMLQIYQSEDWWEK